MMSYASSCSTVPGAPVKRRIRRPSLVLTTSAVRNLSTAFDHQALGAPTKSMLDRPALDRNSLLPRNLGGAFKSEAVFADPGAPRKPRVRISMEEGEGSALNLQDAFVECLDAPWAPVRNHERLTIDAADMNPRRLFD